MSTNTVRSSIVKKHRRLPFAPVCHHHVQVQERYGGGLGLRVLIYVRRKSALLNCIDKWLIKSIRVKVAHIDRCNSIPWKVIENPFVRKVVQVNEAQGNSTIVAR